MVNIFKLFFISFLVFQPQAKGSNHIHKELNSLGLAEKNVGILFEGAGTKTISINKKKNFIPASLTKLITAATAMDHLSLNFKWSSYLSSSANNKNASLNGNLCFYGGGNPNFLTEQLWVLVNHFKRNGIKKIKGDLLIDESFFDSEYFDDKRMKKRVLRAYDSPVGGASFNWNSVNIYVRPGKTIGQKAKVYLDPENDYVKFENKLTTSNSKSYVNIKRTVKNGVEIFILSGRISIKSDEKVYYRPIKNPKLWTGYNIKKALQTVGVKLTGQVRSGKCLSSEKILAKVESKDFSLVIRDLMKYSNNFVAEVLAKTLVKESSGKQGNMDEALLLINSYLSKLGSKSHQIFSVSGLSYHNRVEAESLMKILTKFQSNFELGSEFVSSLPISNVDGTLKSRFSSEFKNKVRAKTGLLNGVVGLAGYGEARSGKSFKFVLIYNGDGSLATWKVRNLFDKMVMDYAKNN